MTRCVIIDSTDLGSNQQRNEFTIMAIPILFNQMNCPYSQRARMALTCAGIAYDSREADPGNLPENIRNLKQRIQLPLLLVNNEEPLDHSLDIMHWALLENDPDGWLNYEVDCLDKMRAFMKLADRSFAQDVLKYVNWDNAAGRSREEYRKDCELFIAGLEQRLSETRFLFGNRVSMPDFAIFPFVHLFTQIKLEWFRKALYPNVWKWLDHQIESELFKRICTKQSSWNQKKSSIDLNSQTLSSSCGD